MAKILVIDDDDAMNDMLVTLLTQAGYEVCGVLNGSLGLKMFGEKTFDLVISDIVMPEKEGLETIREIRAKNKTVPIIAISGGGRLNPGGYLALAKSLGANRAFEKPFDKKPFLEAIAECLA